MRSAALSHGILGSLELNRLVLSSSIRARHRQRIRVERPSSTVNPIQDPDSITDDAVEVSNSMTSSSVAVEDERSRLWKAAIKVPMYWVAVIPPLVGAGAAYYETGAFYLLRTLRLLLGGICVIAWLNLSNDVFDHGRGADVQKKESIVNLTGNKRGIFLLSLVFLATGLVALGSTLTGQRSWSACVRLIAAVLCGYIYQGPPFRLAYYTLGEPLCFIAFGPLATTAFYLLLSNATHVSLSCWAAAILVGWTTTLVLFCSHFHQHDTDKAVKKLSPVVRLGGAQQALKILSASMVCFFALVVGLVVTRILPARLIPLSTIPLLLSIRCVQYGRKHLTDLTKLRFLKLYALDIHASFGIALLLTFTISPLLQLI